MAKTKGDAEKIGYWLSEEGLANLTHIARHCVNLQEIAAQMGIAQSTLYKWKKDHAEISEAIKRTHPIVINELESSLKRLAEGFTQVVNGKEVYFPPNPTAVIFALKNKDSQHYRDRREVELSGNVGISDAIAQAVRRAEAAADES